MNLLIDFFSLEGTDDRGRTLNDYLQADDDWWERTHDHVQWAFPLPEPSKMNRAAPTATDEFYGAVAGQPERMLLMAARYHSFLRMTDLWRRERDHNHLRITRTLRCLTLSGLTEQAGIFHQDAVAGAPLVTGTTRWYWAEALKAEPEWL